MLAAAAGAAVVAGCLRNASAVGRFAAAREGTTVMIPAGEMWPGGGLRPAVEDLIEAGAILAMLDPASLSPEGRVAVGAYRATGAGLAEALASSVSGRELIDAGFGADVAIAAEIDATDLVPLLVNGAFQVQ